MSEPIISRAQLRDKGARAFARGVRREDHPFNWHAPAIAEWQQGWDDAKALKVAERRREAVAA